MAENMPPSPAVTMPPRKGGAFKWVFILLIILALCGVIVALLSELNSRRYFLVVEGNRLGVKKGIYFVTGHDAYRPADPKTAGLYGPIELPAGYQAAQTRMFEDLASLNREFGEVLIRLAKQGVVADDEKTYRKGKAYLERAVKMQGLDAGQLETIQALNADVDYIEAKLAYRGVEQILEGALKKFKKAETFGTGRFPDTQEWIRKVTRLLESIRAAKAGVLPQPQAAQQPPATDVLIPVPIHPQPAPQVAPQVTPQSKPINPMVSPSTGI